MCKYVKHGYGWTWCWVLLSLMFRQFIGTFQIDFIVGKLPHSKKKEKKKHFKSVAESLLEKRHSSLQSADWNFLFFSFSIIEKRIKWHKKGCQTFADSWYFIPFRSLPGSTSSRSWDERKVFVHIHKNKAKSSRRHSFSYAFGGAHTHTHTHAVIVAVMGLGCTSSTQITFVLWDRPTSG